MKRKRQFWKTLLISSLFTFISVPASTAYAQATLWIEYDDFETVSKSENLWQIGTYNMSPDYNPYFDDGKMIQEAKAVWYDYGYFPWDAPRVRSWAMPLAIRYITGIGARVTIDQFDYTHPGYSPDTIIGRLGMIFYNDGSLGNSGDGTDRTSEVFAAIEIRPAMVLWYVVRLKDKDGVAGDTMFLQLFPNTEFTPADLLHIPFNFKLWFDGTSVYFSAETEGPAGEIIRKESTYTPAGEILPPKSAPLGILESIIGIPYLSSLESEPDPNDLSSVKNEWDDVWVAVEATNLGAVKHIIKEAKKVSKWK